MLALTIIDGKVFEDIGQPSVFTDDACIDRILKNKEYAALVEGSFPPGTIIGRLGRCIGGVYDEAPPEDLNLDKYVAKGDLNFYEKT